MESPLLNAEAVAHGEALRVLARNVVEGYRVGEHRSPFSGFAIEFAQHREYAAGDDIRHLDWKVLGRTDRLYIKQYEQDTNFVAHLVVDGSASMNYGGGEASKLHFAKALAACLAYVVLSQRDGIALSVFDTCTREHSHRTDSMGKLRHILDHLAAFEATGGTNLGQTLDEVSLKTRSRGIVVLFSDLLDDEQGLLRGLQKLSFQGNEVVVFHVLDHNEITFPFEGNCSFVGLEDSGILEVNPKDLRRGFLDKMDDFRARMRLACEKFNAHYVLADTSYSLTSVLNGYLAFRRNTKKAR